MVPRLQQIWYQGCSKHGTKAAANTVPRLQQIRYQGCSKYGTNAAANTVPTLQQIRYQGCSKYGTNAAANTVPRLQQIRYNTTQQITKHTSCQVPTATCFHTQTVYEQQNVASPTDIAATLPSHCHHTVTSLTL